MFEACPQVSTHTFVVFAIALFEQKDLGKTKKEIKRAIHTP